MSHAAFCISPRCTLSHANHASTTMRPTHSSSPDPDSVSLAKHSLRTVPLSNNIPGRSFTNTLAMARSTLSHGGFSPRRYRTPASSKAYPPGYCIGFVSSLLGMAHGLGFAARVEARRGWCTASAAPVHHHCFQQT